MNSRYYLGKFLTLIVVCSRHSYQKKLFSTVFLFFQIQLQVKHIYTFSLKTNITFKLDVQFLIHTYVFQTSLTEQKDYKVFNVLHKYSVHFWHDVLSRWIDSNLIWCTFSNAIWNMFEYSDFAFRIELFYMTIHFSFEHVFVLYPGRKSF